MPCLLRARWFLGLLVVVWAGASCIGFAMAKANPLIGVIADRVMADMDTNRDDKISRAEFAHARGVHFEAADKDGDGYVTPEEFTAELVNMTGELGFVWGNQFFSVMDRDTDNLLARDEVDNLGDAVFTSADRNGDGFVTPGEVHPSLAMAK